MATLKEATIVLLAKNYNPSILSKEWLIKKKILARPIGKFVHSPNISLVDAAKVNLVLDENRLQLALRRPDTDRLISITSSARRFVRALPETPYSAIGFNFRFDVPADSLAVSTILTPVTDTITKLFGENCSLGARVDFEFLGFRVGADIPAPTRTATTAEISFNFHDDVAGANEALEGLEKHHIFANKARSIVYAVAPDA